MEPAMSSSSLSSSSPPSLSSPSSSSLLSTTEHHAFMSFLHTVDDLDADWQAYAHLAPPPPHAASALAKATKDLIALHPTPAPRPRPIAPAPSSPPPPPPRLPAAARPPKRRRASPPPSPPPLAPPSSSPPKTALLSVQQKKANHIQSEQKRRANIRRGYEALCDTVPALREALRAAEEQGNEGRRKRARVDEGEKVDGRAGPRSENVVLQKTIDHIRALRSEENALLMRLDRARSVLGPGHPACIPQTPPLWERVWDGGKGLMSDEPGDEDDD